MRVGYLSDESDHTDLRESLQDLGHTVNAVSESAEITDCELVIIAVDEARLPEYVEALALHARRGQIFVHTALSYGAQILDPLETTGAVVAALAPLAGEIWVIDALDELGSTIIELLAAELGLRVFPVPDSRRQRLLAGLSFARFAEAARNDAASMLLEALGNEKAACDIARGVVSAGALPGVDKLSAQHAAMADPGLARSFVDLARRTAEQTGADDIELWAIGQDRGS
ncbi:hypothetical protein C3B44_10095 [Corynebacterium yudongzhengii]|uniref:Uncharacterized protein n=2 Tax=Corynebacterium yudongzhengii TaxID=2080740 RepID=A0A2U1T5W9_9CORY|nr:hypothetical protein C3B44_10095 [Corynebacterium yudongzhengii]PWC01394.1 hypothetical protein DF222_07665 [Corynebacterium yudongzhengii]